MRYPLIILLTLFLVSPCLAGDIDFFTISLEIAADSSDSGVVYDTTISQIIDVGDWPAMARGWEIWDDSNFANDSIFLIPQTAWRYGIDEHGNAVTWDVVDASLVDTIALRTDSVSHDNKIIAADSVYRFCRIVGIHAITISGATAQSLAGNTYDFDVRYYLEKKGK